MFKNAKINGFVIKYLNIALNDFVGEDLDNFEISLIQSPNEIKVIFSPKFHPDEGHVLGGKTKYGREVTYLFDHDSTEIKRKHFSR